LNILKKHGCKNRKPFCNRVFCLTFCLITTDYRQCYAAVRYRGICPTITRISSSDFSAIKAALIAAISCFSHTEHRLPNFTGGIIIPFRTAQGFWFSAKCPMGSNQETAAGFGIAGDSAVFAGARGASLVNRLRAPSGD